MGNFGGNLTGGGIISKVATEKKSPVYVSGSDNQAVVYVQMLLKELGHTITFDLPGFPFDTENPNYVQKRWLAEAKRKAIGEAEALILVFPKEGDFDPYIEAGIAIGLGKKVFVVQGLGEFVPGHRDIKEGTDSLFWTGTDTHYIWNRTDFVKIENYLHPKPMDIWKVEE